MSSQGVNRSERLTAAWSWPRGAPSRLAALTAAVTPGTTSMSQSGPPAAPACSETREARAYTPAAPGRQGKGGGGAGPLGRHQVTARPGRHKGGRLAHAGRPHRLLHDTRRMGDGLGGQAGGGVGPDRESQGGDGGFNRLAVKGGHLGQRGGRQPGGFQGSGQ